MNSQTSQYISKYFFRDDFKNRIRHLPDVLQLIGQILETFNQQTNNKQATTADKQWQHLTEHTAQHWTTHQKTSGEHVSTSQPKKAKTSSWQEIENVWTFGFIDYPELASKVLHRISGYAWTRSVHSSCTATNKWTMVVSICRIDQGL